MRDLILIPAQDDLRRCLFSRWAEGDPAAAITFARALPKALRDAAVLFVAQGWLSSRPDEATAWIRQLEPGSLKNELLNEAVRTVAIKDPQGALSLVEMLPAKFRSSSYANVFGAWAAVDPVGAVDASKKLGLHFLDRVAVCDAIASAWAARDPQGALQWVGSLPLGREKATAYNRILASWVLSDPTAAEQYVLALPSGADRNAAIRAVAGGLSPTDPEGAIHFAEKLPTGRESQYSVARSGHHMGQCRSGHRRRVRQRPAKLRDQR